MFNTLDTNIFIRGQYNPIYNVIGIEKFLRDEKAFLPLTLQREIYSTIQRINVFYHQLRLKLATQNFLDILKEQFVKDFEKHFEKRTEEKPGFIIEFLKKQGNKIDEILQLKQREHKLFFALLRSHIKYYPKNEEELSRLLYNNTTLLNSLSTIHDESDVKHLVICQIYGSTKVQENIAFITKDKRHILTNKKLIENELNFVKIHSFPSWRTK